MSKNLNKEEWISSRLEEIEKEILIPKQFDPSRGAEFISNQYLRSALIFCRENIMPTIKEKKQETLQALLEFEPQRMDDLFIISKHYAWLFILNGVLQHGE